MCARESYFILACQSLPRNGQSWNYELRMIVTFFHSRLYVIDSSSILPLVLFIWESHLECKAFFSIVYPRCGIVKKRKEKKTEKSEWLPAREGVAKSREEQDEMGGLAQGIGLWGGLDIGGG